MDKGHAAPKHINIIISKMLNKIPPEFYYIPIFYKNFHVPAILKEGKGNMIIAPITKRSLNHIMGLGSLSP